MKTLISTYRFEGSNHAIVETVIQGNCETLWLKKAKVDAESKFAYLLKFEREARNFARDHEWDLFEEMDYAPGLSYE